jgi:hypothetical protein
VKTLPIIVAFFAIAGCSTASKNITPTAVSPVQYQAHNCEQLAAEAARVNTRTAQLGARLDEAASNDRKLGWVTALFWPAAFWMGGTKSQEAEYAQLKGESTAIQQVAIMKNCAASPQVLATPTKATE